MANKKRVLICDKCGAENWSLASEGKSHDQPANEVKGYDACDGVWRLPDRAGDRQPTGVVIQFPKRTNEPDVPGMTPERRQLLAEMTPTEAHAGAQAWREHARQCRSVGMAPTPFTNWLAEWLECRRAEQERPLSEESETDEGRHERRDYARMFEGVRE